MEIYKTNCDLCPARFSTTTALLRHRNAKHPTATSVASLPFYSSEKTIRVPTRNWRGRRPVNYKQWLCGVVDSINSCLHPKAQGKWCRVERFHVPEEYVQILLADMPNAFLNSAREKRHLRPPVWREVSKVLHYRDFHMSDVVYALGERSGLSLSVKKTYAGDKEVAERSHPLTGREALEAAKARARGEATASHSVPTMQLQLVVGYGEGRATREFETIWWPKLYSNSNHGKLTLRFYVSKILF